MKKDFKHSIKYKPSHKTKRNYFGIILIILLITALFFPFVPLSFISIEYSDINNLEIENLKILQISGKICIDNNWSDAKDAGICTGSGLYDDPYVIKDLVIDGGGFESCILIKNSNVYFLIENCTVYNSGSGEYDAGIRLSFTSKGKIFNNNCSRYNYNGIMVYYSDNNTITHNTANENNYRGIYLWESNNNSILGNTINNNSCKGIELLASYNNTIFGNNASNNKWYGIHLSLDNKYNTISDNSANNNNYTGIKIDYSDDNDISGNTVSYNYWSGVFLWESNNNTISENIAENNHDGIHLSQSNTNSISGNTANKNNYTGIELSSSNNNTVLGNIAIYNDIGIELQYSNYTLVSWNSLFGNIKCIFETQDCIGNIFENNICSPPTQYYEVYGTGSTLAIHAKNPGGNILKRIPDGWVLKLVDDHDNSITSDGHIWWEVEDKVHTDKCNITGWCASEFLREGDQALLEEKNKRVDEYNERRKTILEILLHYYYNINTISSLYSSNNGQNKLSIFKQNNFPIEIIMAMIAQESGGDYLDNEIYGIDVAGDYENGGIGIMQISASHWDLWNNRGIGSYLQCFTTQCTIAVPEGDIYKHYYYGNYKQGIYANIKDGLRVLQTCLIDAINIDADNPIIGSVWRYNTGFSWEKNIEDSISYLRNVGSRLSSLEPFFGDNYKSILQDNGYIPLNENQIQNWVNLLLNYQYAKIHSPCELRIYDSQNQVTGQINGEINVEIPNSDYFNGSIIMLSPSEDFRYEVVGINEGNYDLNIAFVNEQEIISFNASEIPLMGNQVHEYNIDWDLISQGKEGVRIQIDIDGDGEFDYFFYSDSELSQDEYLDAIQDEKGSPIISGYNLFILIGIFCIVILIIRKQFKNLSF